MHKKAQLAFALNSRAILFRMEQSVPKIESIISLTDFSINGSSVKWCMTDNKGRIIEGRIKDERPLMSHSGSWVTLSLPITIHYFDNVLPAFIFYIPASRRILTEYQFKKEYPGVSL